MPVVGLSSFLLVLMVEISTVSNKYYFLCIIVLSFQCLDYFSLIISHWHVLEWRILCKVERVERIFLVSRSEERREKGGPNFAGEK